MLRLQQDLARHRNTMEVARREGAGAVGVVTHSIISKVAAMAFDEAAIERIGAGFHERRGMVKQLQAADREVAAPEAPSVELQAAVETKAQEFAKKARQHPWWASIVAHERERFFGTALVPIDPAMESIGECPDTIWYITIVCQSPIEVQLLMCTRDTTCPPLEIMSPDQVPAHFGLQTYRHDFKYGSAGEVPELAGDDTRFGVVHVAWYGSSLAVLSDFAEFDTYAASFASTLQPTRARREPRQKADGKTLGKLQDEFPWLSRGEILQMLGGRTPIGGGLLVRIPWASSMGSAKRGWSRGVLVEARAWADLHGPI